MLITADRIHDGRQWLPQGTVIELDDSGKILALHAASDTDPVTRYESIICPGFVNAHCHLELSHMKDLIPTGTGLMQFLKDVIFKREGFTEEQKITARAAAYQELYDNGTVAVGDISNAYETLDIRGRDQMHIYTFVESLGFNPDRAQQSFDHALHVYEQFAAQPQGTRRLKQSIVPHAPYSVSASLFGLIGAHEPGSLMSLHNQECPDEDQYYIDKQGGVSDLLQTIGIDDSRFVPAGKTSLQAYMDWLPHQRPMLLVHNTCTTAADVRHAQQQNPQVYWCLCPNANQYIESSLPDIPMLQQEAGTDHICVGTDSLSSNHQLSVLSELQTIAQAFPQIGWETLLQWATSNGARALQFDDVIGTIEVGKTPGIVLLAEDYSSSHRLY
jgi:aminodeoxyfutalosine deaminase